MKASNLHQFLDQLQRSHLFVMEIEGYKARLKNGESKRSIEKSEVKKALNHLGFHSEIAYKESGQPYLESYPELFVSISHSNGWIAVYVASSPVGIDVETDNPRINLGSDYFVNEQEQQFVGDMCALHVVWGAKEAFFKLQAGKIADLKNEVTILKINDDHSVQLTYSNEVYEFHYFQGNGITVVLN